MAEPGLRDLVESADHRGRNSLTGTSNSPRDDRDTRLRVRSPRARRRELPACKIAFKLYLGQDGTPGQVKAVDSNSSGDEYERAGRGAGLEDLLPGQRWNLHELFPGVADLRFRHDVSGHSHRAAIERRRPAHPGGARAASIQPGQAIAAASKLITLCCSATRPSRRSMLYLSQMKHENVLLRSIVVTLLASSEFFVRATSPTS